MVVGNGVIALWLLITPIATLSHQSSGSWRDPSPHQVRFVTVDSTIRLEVLDWGGTGRPLVFVGCYLTAHVYDDIAPKLRDQFHVYAITRRGIGASDHPSTGYGPQRRADDILDVITSLDLIKPILVGSSCGGDILHTLGARGPERLAGLVYLDAAEDPTLQASDYERVPVDTVHVPACVGSVAASAPFPEAETRQRPLDAAIRRAIVEGNRVRPDYAHVRVPVLAIYRTVTMEQVLKACPPKTDQEREALNQAYRSAIAMLTKWESDLRAVPDTRIVELPGANLYMFLSNEADIIRELRGFSNSLPR